MEVVTTERGIEVTVTRRISIGYTLKINPSEAYLGIESGDIKPVAIQPMNEIERDIADQAEEFTRIHLDGLEGDDHANEYNRLHNDLWVVYQYNHGGEIEALPLEEFVQHTMSY